MKKYFLLFILALISAPTLTFADMGPKPTMSFSFKDERPGITIVASELFECSDEKCSDIKPFQQFGPQRFSCSEEESGSRCFSMSYGYKPYHQLAITFSDKIRKSNIFPLSADEKLDSYYTISVRDTDLVVQPVTATQARLDETSLLIKDSPSSFKNLIGPIGMPKNISDYLFFMFAALTLTLIIELVVVKLYKMIRKVESPRLITILIANLISLPLLWLVAYFNNLNYYIFITIGELAVVLFESFVIAASTEGIRTWKHWFLLSLIMNAASFFLGDLILGSFPALLYILVG